MALSKSQLRSHYEDLVSGKIDLFIVGASGDVIEPVYHKYAFIPGSFNPLHEAHKWMYSTNLPSQVACLFEMSVKRIDKPDVSFEELTERLAQFQDYAPVIITNKARMIEKIGVFFKNMISPDDWPVFHIGMDTLLRMIDDYGPDGIAGLNAEFVVYDRELNGIMLKLDDLKTRPYNCFQGFKMPNELLTISSTNIRKGKK